MESPGKTKKRIRAATIPSLPLAPSGTRVDAPPERLRPEFKKATNNKLPASGPVARFGKDRELPSTVDDQSQVMRFSLHHGDGSPAAWLVKEIFVRGIDTTLALRFGYPAQGDAQGPVTNQDVDSLVRWIDQWVPLLPDAPITLDLSGSHITARKLLPLGECLSRHPTVQALDLSRNRGLTGLLPAKPKTAGRALRKTLTSPRATHKKKPLPAGEAIGKVLACTHLLRLSLNGNPLCIEDRASILQAVAASATLCEFDMADCALSAADVSTLVKTTPNKNWHSLGLGAKLTLGMVNTIANHLLPANPGLVSLDLGTVEPYSSFDVVPVLNALKKHPLERLSLAGHELDGNADKVTSALRRNACLRRLDLSRCTISVEFLSALFNALKRDGTLRPNVCLTQLILPTFDNSPDRDELESLARLCAIAIDRNRVRESRLPQLRADAADALHAGLLSRRSLGKALPAGVCSLIVTQIGGDTGSVRNLAAVAPVRRTAAAVNATPRLWKKGW